MKEKGVTKRLTVGLVAMDLDDTLLRDDLTISTRVVKAIQKAREQGVKITIATGRMPISACSYAEQLGVDVPVITYNGALIQQVLSGEILFRRVIPSALAAEIIQDVTARGFYAQVYFKNRVVTSQLNKRSEQYARVSSAHIEEADLFALLAQEAEGAEKILLIGEEDELRPLGLWLGQRYKKKIHITKSKPIFLEMTDFEVNKGVALAALAKKFGVARKDVMAIGDSFNDLEMIKYAGWGVAMGNARREIKEQADIVTSSNEEDGVAEAIEQYVLK